MNKNVKQTLVMLAVGVLSQSALGSQPVRVENPAKAPKATVAATRELWRIGGESEDPNELFGRRIDLAVDADGRLYTLDSQLAEVKVFDRTGRFLFAAGREGDGPGEFRRPAAVTVLEQGAFCVSQPSPPRLSVFGQDGTYSRTVPLKSSGEGGFVFLDNAAFRAGTFAVKGLEIFQREGYSEQITRIIGIDAQGIELAEYATSSRRFGTGNMVVRESEADPLRWEIGPSGKLYVVFGFEYEIKVIGATGTVEMIITREYEHEMRSEEQRRSVYEYFRRGGGTEGLDIEVMPYPRAIRRFQVGDDGRLWVLSGRGTKNLPHHSLGVFDVFTDGRFLEQVTIQGDADPRRDRYYLFGSRLYVVTDYSRSSGGDEEQGEAQPMSIICLELEHVTSR